MPESINNNNTEGMAIPNIFENTKQFKDITKYRLLRGVPDFGNLIQFNPYESGYACLIICEMPKFIEELGKRNPAYNKLIQNWKHLVEFEFKSLDGLDNMTSEPVQLGTDENQFNVIGKTNIQGGASEFTLQYDEKVGGVFYKFSKLYLNGIMDPRLHIKTYHGLIHDGTLAPGIENEIFTLLFIVLDNTMRDVETSYLITSAQLLESSMDIYNYTKGTIEKRDISLKFSGYPIQHPEIDKLSKEVITYLLSDDAKDNQILLNDTNFEYTGIEQAISTLEDYGFKQYTETNSSNGYSSVSDLRQEYYKKSTGNPNGYVSTDQLRTNSDSHVVIPKNDSTESQTDNTPSKVVKTEDVSINKTVNIDKSLFPSSGFINYQTSIYNLLENQLNYVRNQFDMTDEQAVELYMNIQRKYKIAADKIGFKFLGFNPNRMPPVDYEYNEDVKLSENPSVNSVLIEEYIRGIMTLFRPMNQMQLIVNNDEVSIKFTGNGITSSFSYNSDLYKNTK